MEAFTSSIQIDRRLYVPDIEGSTTHCKMLAKVGILTDEEASTLVQGLEQIRAEIEQGQFLL